MRSAQFHGNDIRNAVLRLDTKLNADLLKSLLKSFPSQSEVNENNFVNKETLLLTFSCLTNAASNIEVVQGRCIFTSPCWKALSHGIRGIKLDYLCVIKLNLETHNTPSVSRYTVPRGESDSTFIQDGIWRNCYRSWACKYISHALTPFLFLFLSSLNGQWATGKAKSAPSTAFATRLLHTTNTHTSNNDRK